MDASTHTTDSIDIAHKARADAEHRHDHRVEAPRDIVELTVEEMDRVGGGVVIYRF
jgi:hypothetical protein